VAETATIPVEEAGAHAPASTPAEQQQPQAGGDQRPEWLPEKFKSPEQMAAAYAELEKRLHGGDQKPAEQETPTDDKPEETDKTTEGGDDDDAPDGDQEVSYGKAVDSALEGVGLTPQGVWEEFQQNQSLTDETYKKLEDAGYPRSVVDAYIGSAQAERQRTETEFNEIRELAGGEQGYSDMVSWARENLSEEQIKSFNTMVTSGDTWQAKAAVQALHAQYSQSEGKEPKLTMGGQPPKADTFRSAKEASVAMREARASGDPAKIRDVEQKMLRSNVFAGG
jgi:hypothetical protein